MAPSNEFDEESKGKEGGKGKDRKEIIIVYFNQLNYSASHYRI